MAQMSPMQCHLVCHRPILTLQPASPGMRVLVPNQPSLRAAPAEVPQHPQQLDQHQRDQVGEQVALADAHGMHSPGEGEQQPGQEEVDAILAAEDLGVFLRVAAARGAGTATFLHLPAGCCRRAAPLTPGSPEAAGWPGPHLQPGAERGSRTLPSLPAAAAHRERVCGGSAAARGVAPECPREGGGKGC